MTGRGLVLKVPPLGGEIAGMGFEEAGEVAAVVDAYASGDEGDVCSGLCKEHLFGFLDAEGGAPCAEIHTQFLKTVTVELDWGDPHLPGNARGMGIVKEILA